MLRLILLAILLVDAGKGGKGKIKCKNLASKTQCQGKIATDGSICMWQQNECVSGEDAEINPSQVCTDQTDYYSCNKYPPCTFLNMQCVYTQACGDVTTKDMCKMIRGCSWNHECMVFGESEEEALDCQGEDNAMDCEGDPERNCVWSGLSCGVFDALTSCPHLTQQWKCESYKCVWDQTMNKCGAFDRHAFCESLTDELKCTKYSCMWLFGKKCYDQTMFGEENEIPYPSRTPSPWPTAFSPTVRVTTASPTRMPSVALPCRVGPMGMKCPFHGGHCNNKNPSTSLEGSLCVTDCTIHQGHYWCYTDTNQKRWGWCYQQKHQTCLPPTPIPTARPTVTSPFYVAPATCLTGKKGLLCPDGTQNCGISLASTADEDQKCVTDCVAEEGKFWCYTNLQPFKLWGWCKVQDAHECNTNKRNAIHVLPPFLEKQRKGPGNPEPITSSGNDQTWLGLSRSVLLAGCVGTSLMLVFCICYFTYAIKKRYRVPHMVDLDLIRDIDEFGMGQESCLESWYSEYQETASPKV